MKHLLLKAALVFGAALACAAQEPGPANTAAGAVSSAPTPQATSDYILGPGDVISLIVTDLPDDFTDKTFRIDMSGDLTIPYAGRVHAAGLTTQGLEQNIRPVFAKIIKEPDVTVGVAEFHSQPVSVLGEVTNAGEYQVQGQKKLLEAISMAGGFSEYVGNTVTITRELQWGRVPLPNAHDDPTGQFSLASVSVKSILHSASPEQNIQVMPGDVITVSKAEVVYVVGSVYTPGAFPLGQDETLSTLQVLSLAQGPEHTADLPGAKIIRLIPGTKSRTELPINLKDLLKGRTSDVALQSGDILFVPDSRLKNAGARTIQAIVNAATGAAYIGTRF